MRSFVLLAALITTPAVASAQDCASMAMFREGAHQVRAMQDDKARETGRTSMDVIAVSTSGATTTATVHSVVTNAKGKEQGAVDYEIACEAGTIQIDMKSFVPAESTEAYKDFTMTMEGGNMAYPSALSAGQTLPDATLKMTFAMAEAGGPVAFPPTVMTFHIGNRVVEGQESVTTPSGTYEAWKLKYVIDVGTKGMISSSNQSSVVEWYVPGIGPVKSETWERDKLQTTTILVEAR